MMDLNTYRHIFFLGIGGVGMSAVARCCLQQGIKVSGYDRISSALTSALMKEGADVVFEDDPSVVGERPDLVIYTPAIPKDSRLTVFFQNEGIKCIKRSEALQLITRGVDTIAVAGTHGKTTTSSMISYLLKQSGIRHTALLGGISSNYRSNFFSDSPDLMVVEADEYDRSFLRLYPKYVVVTAMDPDHLDIYGTYDEMVRAYRQFLRQIQPGGYLLYAAGIRDLIGEELLNSLEEKNIETRSYGIEEGAIRSENLKVKRGVWQWDIQSPDSKVPKLLLQMAGRHNVLNASAACAIALKKGASVEKIARALPGYKGVSRRFEIRYQNEERVLVDDYAHHPEELKAAITAMRETYGEPVTGVFQPHLYTRTRDFAKAFARSLDLLDDVVLMDIYPAREKAIEGVSTQLILDHMHNPNKEWCVGDSWVDCIVAKKPRVLITLGAGDLDKHIPELIRRLYTND